VGLDANWSAFSPGICLFLHNLQNLSDEDFAAVDFGCGDGQFYQCFRSAWRREATVQMYAPRLGALQLHLLHALTHYATVLIRRSRWLNWPRRTVWKRFQAKALLTGARNSETHLSNLQPST
jgi:hypothetical protein